MAEKQIDITDALALRVREVQKILCGAPDCVGDSQRCIDCMALDRAAAILNERGAMELLVLPAVRMLSKPETARKCGVSEASLTRYEAAGDFPSSVKIHNRRCWFEHEIDAYLLALPRGGLT